MPPTRVWAAIGAGACLAAAGACQLIGGIDDIELAQSQEAGTAMASEAGPGGESGVEGNGETSVPSEAGLAQDAIGALDACGATSKCVERAPDGWIGPIYVYEGATAESAPACEPDASFLDASANLNGGAASCESCRCDAATGETCGAAWVRAYNGTTCSNVDSCTTLAVPLDQCTPLGCPSVQSLKLLGVTTTGGACAANTPNVLDLPKATWARQSVACHASLDETGACSANETCAVVPSDSRFAGTMCIAKDGEVACPSSGPFTEAHVYYTGISDTRGCAQSCTCGTPDGGVCSYTQPSTQLYDDPFCGGNIGDLSGNQCHEVSGVAGVVIHVTSAGVGFPGHCAPSGGGPSGNATGTGATTFCCMK